MAVRHDAQRYYDELFPNHVSTLKVTDPELVEMWGNWAFGDVRKDERLDTRTRLLVQLAAPSERRRRPSTHGAWA